MCFCAALKILSLAGGILFAVIVFNIIQGIGAYECDNLVLKLPMEQVSPEINVGLLESLSETTPKIFIKDSANTELYLPSSDANGSCS